MSEFSCTLPGSKIPTPRHTHLHTTTCTRTRAHTHHMHTPHAHTTCTQAHTTCTHAHKQTCTHHMHTPHAHTTYTHHMHTPEISFFLITILPRVARKMLKCMSFKFSLGTTPAMCPCNCDPYQYQPVKSVTQTQTETDRPWHTWPRRTKLIQARQTCACIVRIRGRRAHVLCVWHVRHLRQRMCVCANVPACQPACVRARVRGCGWVGGGGCCILSLRSDLGARGAERAGKRAYSTRQIQRTRAQAAREGRGPRSAGTRTRTSRFWERGPTPDSSKSVNSTSDGSVESPPAVCAHRGCTRTHHLPST